MSERNLQTLQEMVEAMVVALNTQDVEVGESLVHPEAEIHARRSAVQGPYTGRGGVRKFVEDNLENFDAFELRYDDVRGLGEDRLLLLGSVRIKGKGSGIETEVPSGGIMEFRDGLIYRWHDYGQHADALAAAGLEE